MRRAMRNAIQSNYLHIKSLLHTRLEEYKTYFIAPGYKKKLLDDTMNKVLTYKQGDTLQPKEHTSEANRVVFSTTFIPHLT